MISKYKENFRAITEFVARFFMRAGFSPNGLTIFSLVLGLLSCLLFVWNRNAILFGSLMIFVGLFDLVDGALARITNRVTKFGSYLDAMSDRVYEAAGVLAGAYVSGLWFISFTLICGSMMLSYAKARAAMEVPITNLEWPDFMERFERDVIFALGCIVWGIFPGEYGGRTVFFWMLVFLNIAVYIGLTQRFFRARKYIEQRS